MKNPNNRKTYSVPFVVFRDVSMPLLRLPTWTVMKLITVKDEIFCEQLGVLPKVQHISVRPDAKPVVMANHCVPIAVHGKLKEELARLVRPWVITPVEQPTLGSVSLSSP